MRTENIPEGISQQELPPREGRHWQRVPRTPSGQSRPEHSGTWNVNQHQRLAYEAPFIGSFNPTGRDTPPNPWIPPPEAGSRPRFGQSPDFAPWIQPNIFLPDAQRSRERPNPIWQQNFSQRSPVVNSQSHIPQVAAHSRWASPGVNYHNLGSWPPIQRNIYEVSANPGQHQEGHNFNPLYRARYNGRERLPNFLSNGGLTWDIRFPPSTSKFDPVRSFAPNLDTPALSDSIQVAEICFPPGRGMKYFTYTWGSIHVRRRYSLSSISIKDILETIYRFFMEPLSMDETRRFEAIPAQKDEMVMAYRMRQRAQGTRDHLYRRCDLLQNGMCNFDTLEVQSENRNTVRLLLRLY